MFNSRSMFDCEKVQVNLLPGDFLFRQGETGDVAYVLLDGEIELLVGDIKIASFGPGDIFGEMALLEHCERSADAVAKSECRLAALDQKRFLYLVQQTPRFALHVMGLLSERLRNTTERVICQSV